MSTNNAWKWRVSWVPDTGGWKVHVYPPGALGGRVLFRATRTGARFTGWWLAWKMNRYEAKGWL